MHISSVTADDIEKETQRDTDFRKMFYYVQNGWSYDHKVDDHLKSYQNRKMNSAVIKDVYSS